MATESKETTVPGTKLEEDDPATMEEVPDPDEDDLDDLDDMLDDFSSLKVKPPQEGTSSVQIPPAVTTATTQNAEAGPAAGEPSLESLMTDDDFTKQLQAGMADLLGEIESSPEMKAQFESIFKEFGAAAAAAETDATPMSSGAAPAPAASTATPSTAANTGPGSASFQDTIRQTMERMQASGEQATAAASAGESDDFMAELLKQMEAGGFGAGAGVPGGEGSEEDFSKMLLGMMEQLTNKEILYEPMKELDDKFPGWLEKNGAATSEADLKRYKDQRAVVREIVAKFEEPTFTDENAQDRQYIVDRMQKMQSYGSPPPDLVGDMPSAQDALGMSDESCPVQ